jgi:hypothetical protein
MAQTVKITPALGKLEFIGDISLAASTSAIFTGTPAGSVGLVFPAAQGITITGSLTINGSAKFSSILDSANVTGTLNYVIAANNSGGYTWTNVFDILGGAVVPSNRTLTINGTSYNLSADRTWSIDLDSVTDINATTTNALTVGGITSPYFQFNKSIPVTPVEGMAFWESDNTFPTIQINANLSGRIFEDEFWCIKNQTGSLITKGTVVMAVGTVGASARMLGAPMIANGSVSQIYILGVAAENIPNGADGSVVRTGKIRGINTAVWPNGTVLYADPANPGQLTSTVPQAPNLKLAVAFVVHSATNGVLAIRVQLGSDLYEDNRVQIVTALANGQLLRYNSTTARWENWAPNYLSAESDTLQTVTTRGNTTSYAITINNSTDATSSATGALVVAGGAGFGGNVYIDGDLVVGGTTTTISARNLKVSDNMIYLNNGIDATVVSVTANGTIAIYTTFAAHGYTAGMDVTVYGLAPDEFNTQNAEIIEVTPTTFTVESSANGTIEMEGFAVARSEANPDIGLAAGYNDGSYKHGGLFRDASDGVWKVFQGYTPEPDESPFIDTAHPSFDYAPFRAAAITGTSFVKVGGTSSQFLKADGSVDSTTYLSTESDPYRITAVAVTGTATKTITITRADSTTVTTTWTDLDTNTDTNYYVTSAAFNTSNGVLTLTRNDAGTVTVDLDGRYSEIGHTHTVTTGESGLITVAGISDYVFSIDSRDTRAVANTPSDYDKGLYLDFKNSSIFPELEASGYKGQMIWRSYGAAADMSGGFPLQIVYDQSGKIHYRLGINATDWSDQFLTIASQQWVVSQGYLTTETDPTVPSHVKAITTTNISNWNTAYGWGNHASAGYLTSYTETDTLASVTARGSVTNGSITVQGGQGASETTDGYGLEIMGNYTNGQYNHRLAKFDKSGGVPLYVQSTSAVANVWSNSARFGVYTGNGYEFEVYGAAKANGDFAATGQINASGGNSSQWNTAYGWGNHASASYATQTYVNTAISNLVNSAPTTLDTLNELAAALGNDPNFATTVTTSIGNKVSKAGDTMTGNLTTTGLIVGNGVDTGRQPFGPLAKANIILTSSATDSSGVSGIEFLSGNNFPSDGASIYFENNTAGGGSERAKLTIRVDNDQEDFLELRAGKVVINANTYSGGGQNPAIIFQHDDVQIASISSSGQINALGGNSTQWNAAYNDKVNSASFNSANGVLTLTQQDGGVVTVNLDGRYLTSETDSQTLSWTADSLSLTISNGNTVDLVGLATESFVTSQGYITSYSEVDTLASVTARGATTNTTLTLGKVITTGLYGHSIGGINSIWQYDANNLGYGIVYNEGSPDTLRIDVSGQAVTGTPDFLVGPDYAQVNGNTVWHAGNLTNLNQLTNGPGYITSYTETDTLASVTNRGNSTTDRINVRGIGNQGGGNIMMGNAGEGNTKWSYLTSTHFNASSQPQGFALIGGLSTGDGNAVVIGGNIYETNPATEIQFWTHSATTHNLGGSLRGIINQVGNWGIGTSDPGSYRLYVNGGQFGTLLRGGDLGTGSDVVRMIKSDNSVAMLVRGDGNVAIGMSNPPSLLYVGAATNFVIGGRTTSIVGPADSETILTITRSGLDYPQMLDFGVSQSGLYATISARQFTSEETNLILQPNGGSVGIGTTNPLLHTTGSGLVVRGSGRGIIELWDATAGKAVFQQVGGDTYIGSLDKGTGTGDLYLLVNGSGTSADNAALIKANGNYLIGTTVDSGFKLRVVGGGLNVVSGGDGGNTYFEGSSGNNTQIGFDGVGGYIETLGASAARQKLRLQTYNGSAYTQLFIDGANQSIYTSSNANVGIQVSGPTNKLQIGSVGSSGYGGNDFVVGDGTTVFALYMGANLTNFYTNKAFSFQNSGAGSTGNVLIGTTTDDGFKLNVNGTIRATSDIRAPIFYDSNDTNYYLDPNTNSRVSRLWVDGNGAIGTYSWVNAAITTNSIEIVNSANEVDSSPTLAFHWYGDGGPQFRLAADNTNILYLESADENSANTATNTSTYFNSLRLICQDTNGLYVNGNKVWHIGNDGSGSGLDADLLDGYHETSFVRLATTSSSPTNGTFAIGSASGRNFIQSHSGQPLDINPLGNAVTIGSGVTVSGVVTATGGNSTNWNTAFSWGNHAGLYISSTANNTLSGKLTLTYNDTAEPFAQLELRGSTTHSGIYINPVDGAQAHIRFAANNELKWQIRAPFQTGGDCDLEIYSWVTSNGDFKFTHGGTLTIADKLVELSSIRYKTSIEPILSALDNIGRLRPVTYTKIGKTETELGLIAEEVAEVYPEVVKYDQDGRPDGINYSRLSVVLLKAVQELTEKIKKLES